MSDNNFDENNVENINNMDKDVSNSSVSKDPVVSNVSSEDVKDGATSVKKKSFNKWIILLIALVLLLASVIGVLLFNKNRDSSKPAGPIPVGHSIIVPDVTDAGKDKTIGAANPDPSAPKYVDPSNLDAYRHVDSNGNVTIEAPLDGKCAIGSDGAILPPDNYLHICYYEKNGSIYYTSHAVIGPKTGALENIQYLKPGMQVIVDGQKYVVTNVDTFDKNHLPDYLFKPGQIGLVTCHIDASVKTFKDFNKTDVVRLKKA